MPRMPGSAVRNSLLHSAILESATELSKRIKICEEKYLLIFLSVGVLGGWERTTRRNKRFTVRPLVRLVWVHLV